MRNAKQTRAEHFRALLHGRVAAYSLVLGMSATFLVGASMRNPVVMLVFPATVVVAVVFICYAVADQRAKTDFFLAFANARGLAHWPHYEVLPYTPLLGAEDRRRFDHWIEGRLDDDPPLEGGFGCFVAQRVHRDGDGRERPTEIMRLTVGVMEVEAALGRYHGVFLRPRRGLLELGKDWLHHRGTRAVELESTRFTERYELRIADDQDEVELRRLFTPSLIAWLAEHPLAPGLELKAGVLVVFVMRTLEDDGNLTFFLDAMRHIGARVVAEAAETSPV